MTTAQRRIERDALVSRVGAQLAARLDEHAQALPPDITERLRFAREQAAARARRVARVATAPALAMQDGTAALGGPGLWLQRLGTVFPLLLLVVGLMLVGEWTTREQVLAAADIDAVLLADEVPPAAYADPGFAEFLRSAPP